MRRTKGKSAEPSVPPMKRSGDRGENMGAYTAEGMAEHFLKLKMGLALQVQSVPRLSVRTNNTGARPP